MGETSKTGGEKSSCSASTASPGRKLVTSKSPWMLKPCEIDLLRRQDLRAALARLRAGAEPVAGSDGDVRACLSSAEQCYGSAGPQGGLVPRFHWKRHRGD